jgi:hypothetical protein
MQVGDWNVFKKLVSSDWTFVALITSFFVLCLGQWVAIPYPILLGAGLTLFTAFDVYGYGSIDHSDRGFLTRYRIVQVIVQWLVFILLGLLTHWNTWVCFGYVYLWWMGVCDVLFYILLGKFNVMLSYGDMPWLWWTPIGIFNRYSGRTTAGLEVFHITLYSVILWFSIWVFRPSIHTRSISETITYLLR